MAAFHTHACILSSGDEIITGQLLDTNSRFLAEQLTSIGISVAEFAAVPDELDQLVEAILRLGTKAPLLIMSGGLGPTEGDLTRHALAKVMGQDLVTDETVLTKLSAWLESRGRELNPRQARQALRPVGAECLDNTVGTAAGLCAQLRGTGIYMGPSCDVFCLPGPPSELGAMWTQQVVPRLRVPPGRVVATRLLHLVGIPEADLVTRLGTLMSRDRMPLVGVTASQGMLTLRMRCLGQAGGREATELLDADEHTICAMIGDHLVGKGERSLVHCVLDELVAARETLATVESCTGGLLGALVTAVPGSSAAFAGGLVTYSNELKTKLAGVDASLITRCGAVSSEVASAMATGGKERLGANHCIAITGVAGPDGGSEHKPVGTVYIAHACNGKDGGHLVDVRRFAFTGTREDIRQRAARTGLSMVHFQLIGRRAGEPKLLWQI